MVDAGGTATVGQTIALIQVGETTAPAADVKTNSPLEETPASPVMPKQKEDKEEKQEAPTPKKSRMSPSRRRALRAGEGEIFEDVKCLRPLCRAPFKTIVRRKVCQYSARRRIAERLVMSQQTGALLTTSNEVNLAQVKNIRREYQEQFIKKYGIKLGFMSFLCCY